MVSCTVHIFKVYTHACAHTHRQILHDIVLCVLSALLQEKEQLLVETQLLKMKLEREQKGSPNHRNDKRPGSGRRKEEVDSATAGGDDESQVSEGELVQKHFAARVADLSAQVRTEPCFLACCCVYMPACVLVCVCAGAAQ